MPRAAQCVPPRLGPLCVQVVLEELAPGESLRLLKQRERVLPPALRPHRLRHQREKGVGVDPDALLAGQFEDRFAAAAQREQQASHLARAQDVAPQDGGRRLERVGGVDCPGVGPDGLDEFVPRCPAVRSAHEHLQQGHRRSTVAPLAPRHSCVTRRLIRCPRGSWNEPFEGEFPQRDDPHQWMFCVKRLVCTLHDLSSSPPFWSIGRLTGATVRQRLVLLRTRACHPSIAEPPVERMKKS